MMTTGIYFPLFDILCLKFELLFDFRGILVVKGGEGTVGLQTFKIM